jgi:hypothetical protein
MQHTKSLNDAKKRAVVLLSAFIIIGVSSINPLPAKASEEGFNRAVGATIQGKFAVGQSQLSAQVNAGETITINQPDQENSKILVSQNTQNQKQILVSEQQTPNPEQRLAINTQTRTAQTNTLAVEPTTRVPGSTLSSAASYSQFYLPAAMTSSPNTYQYRHQKLPEQTTSILYYLAGGMVILGTVFIINLPALAFRRRNSGQVAEI